MSSKKTLKKSNDKQLTLSVLANYNQKVLFPALEELFVTKKDFKEFRNEMLTDQDMILKKLDILLTEKTVRDHQREKEKELWLIVLNALKQHEVLTSKELKRIAQLDIF